MEQNRKPRDKSTHPWTPYLQERNQECTMEKRQSLYQVVLGKVISQSVSSVMQSCPTLCDPIDSTPPGSAVPGILHARVLEWGAIAFSGDL